MKTKVIFSETKQDLKAQFGSVYVIKGDDGESAYEIAVRNGFNGSETEWLDSLHGKGGDWDASEGEPGFIANRTHWKSTAKVILEETYISQDTVDGKWAGMFGYFGFNLPKPLEVGSTYTVIFNGKEHTVTATEHTLEHDDGTIEKYVQLNDGVFRIEYYENGVLEFDGLYNTAFNYDGCETEEYDPVNDVPYWIPATLGITAHASVHKLDPVFLDLPKIEMAATFADGTTVTYNLYGEAVM